MLQSLFNAKGTLTQIEATLRPLYKLHIMLKQAIPETLRAYCHSVYWSEKTLMVNITHSAALCKIRQLCPTLLETLRQQGIDVEKVKPIIFFEDGKPAPLPKAQQMTHAALEAFQHLQQNVNDPGLKKAIGTLLEAHQAVIRAK